MGKRDQCETGPLVRLERGGSICIGQRRDVRRPRPYARERGSSRRSLRSQAEQREKIGQVDESDGLSFLSFCEFFTSILAVKQSLQPLLHRRGQPELFKIVRKIDVDRERHQKTLRAYGYGSRTDCKRQV